MNLQKGSVLVIDKGYSDYSWHNQLTSKGIFWVIRTPGNAKYRVLERRKVNKFQGITSDQVTKCTSNRSCKNNLKPVRRVGFRGAETGKHYVFIISHFDWSARTIASIYKT